MLRRVRISSVSFCIRPDDMRIAPTIRVDGRPAPVTLVAKGLEGGCAALAGRRQGLPHWAWLVIGGALMMATYFVGEWLMPNIGLQGAVSELGPNLIQAASGVIGGRLTFAAYQRLVEGTRA